MTPGRSTDIEVAEKVFGLKVTQSEFNSDYYMTEHGHVKEYSTSREDADEIMQLFSTRNTGIQRIFSEHVQKALSARLSDEQQQKVIVPEWRTFLIVKPIDLCVGALKVFSGGKE